VTSLDVEIRTVGVRTVAAVRRTVRLQEISEAYRPALDPVWAFLQQRPGLRTDGPNVFVYHAPAERGDPMDVDFGVQVVRPFDGSGEVRSIETPPGPAASVVHRGPYRGLRATHAAVQAWAAATGIVLAGTSWEIYGDWVEDPAQLTTQVEYLLA
jgi:effector-binding domain-containing protein